MTYILTAQAFREAHPELASRAWIEESGDERFICYPDRLLGTVARVQLGVPLCDCCDKPDCEALTEVHDLGDGRIAA